MISWIKNKLLPECFHPNGHLAIEEMSMRRFFFVCENCGHNFNLWKHEFTEEQLDWLIPEDDEIDRRCKFKFKNAENSTND